jgi:hypothetical protein
MAGSASPRQPNDFQIDLMVKQVTEGLTPAESRALDSLDPAVRGRFVHDLEQAAAALTVAGSAGAAPLPEALRRRIEAQAPVQAVAARTQSRAAFPLSMAGWWAAAACLCIAVFTWVYAPTSPESARLSPEDQRAALLASGMRRIPVGATQDPYGTGVSGDIVWDPATQRGFLRIAGLAHNDPGVNQYQIWIFDAERDPRYPVDGGVFDIPANAHEVLVPIRAGIPVRSAKAFAVTVEKPGGVVVSARDRVVALAQTG